MLSGRRFDALCPHRVLGHCEPSDRTYWQLFSAQTPRAGARPALGYPSFGSVAEHASTMQRAALTTSMFRSSSPGPDAQTSIRLRTRPRAQTRDTINFVGGDTSNF
jgi:hypothetical protein